MIARFTLCDDIVVTADACADYFIVIQRGNKVGPRSRRYAMTGFTVVRGIRVITWFTLRNRSIVTTKTGTDYFIMIQWRYKR